MQHLIRMDITNNCNLRCKSCQLYAAVPKKDVTYLDFELFRQRTRGQLNDWKAIQLGNTAEPTIHPDFEKYLAYLQEEFSGRFTLITNGTTLHRYAPLINRKPCTVGVSLDSVNPATYAKIRRGSSLDKVLSGIAGLDRRKVRVSASFTLMRSNIEEFDDMVRFCRENDIEMGFQPMSMRSFITPHGHFVSLEHMLECLLLYPDTLSHWLDTHQDLLCGGRNRSRNEACAKTSRCTLHYDDLMLFASGAAMLCVKKMHPGLAASTLREVFFSEEYEAFRKEVDATRSPCRYCTYNVQCVNSYMDRIEAYLDEFLMSLLKKADSGFLGVRDAAPTRERIARLGELLGESARIVHVGRDGAGHVGIDVSSLPPAVLAGLDHASDLAPLLARGEAVRAEGLGELYSRLGEDLELRRLGEFARAHGRRTAIWGSSRRYQERWEEMVLSNPHGLEFVGVIDSDSRKWGQTVSGLPVRGPEFLREAAPDIVIIASTYVVDITDQIRSIVPDRVDRMLLVS